jgi:hypothetical protein
MTDAFFINRLQDKKLINGARATSENIVPSARVALPLELQREQARPNAARIQLQCPKLAELFKKICLRIIFVSYY